MPNFRNTLQITTTSEQRPLFVGPKGGRCTQAWLYLEIINFVS